MSAPEFRFRLTLEATVSPSEDPEKVAGALGAVVGLGQEAVAAEAHSVRLVTTELKALDKIREQLRDRHVRSAARRRLLVNREGARSKLLLNRQAAAVGVVAVCDSPAESQLGPIFLTITSDKLEKAIDWLTDYPGG